MDIKCYFEKNSNTIYRLWEYKRMFTPYEVDKKFIDEGVFVDSMATFVKVVDVINIPNDVLIKFRVLFEEYDDFNSETLVESDYFTFKRLSDICLEEYDSDNRRTIQKSDESLQEI